MSQAPHDNIDVPNPGPNTGDHQYPPGPPLSAQNQEPPSRGISDHVDGSGPIFSLYLEMATEEDKKMAESWKDDADGILIFTGLFSAAVASLISVSIQDLRLNPQDTSNFYLANTYQATINPNTSSSLPTSPAPFTPPNYAIWVNALWFLSLVISITCALLATLLQQWARRYLKVTQPRYSPHKRARIRAFFAEGVNKFLLPWAVEALPTMLHLSLFLFFAGLAVFLWNVNLTIFKLVLSWIGLCTALYGCITFIPIFCHDSPYHTPLSLPVWHLVTGIPFLIFRALERLTLSHYFSYGTWDRFQRLAESYGRLIARGMQKMAEESALSSPPEIDTRAFLWTFDCLDEDHELERFFAGLPGFRSSKMVKDPLPNLTWEQQDKLVNALIGLSDRTSSSDLLPEQVKTRRTVICGKAIGAADFPEAIWPALYRVTSEDEYGPVQSAEIARLVRGWDNGEDEATAIIMRAIVSAVVARAQRHDDLWFATAAEAMGLPESVLRTHATHGDSLSLAILIHVVRQQFSFVLELDWPDQTFWKVLEAASKFDVQDTSPELQHEFCELWNQVVRASYGLWWILRPIRNIYLTLHLYTDSAPTAFSAATSDKDDILGRPSTYPLCNIPGHHPDSTPRIHDAAAPTAVAHPVLPASVTTNADAPSRSLPSLVLVDENTTDVPLPDNDISVLPSSDPAHQPAAKKLSNSASSPDPLTTAGATLGINTSARTTPHTGLETSTATASVRPTGEHSLQNIPDPSVHPDARLGEIPPPASPEPVLGVIAESRCLILATTSPGTPPLPPSAPELGAAEDTPKAGPRSEKDAFDPPSVNRTIQANTMAILERPPPTILPSAPEINIANPSLQGLDAEHA